MFAIHPTGRAVRAAVAGLGLLAALGCGSNLPDNGSAGHPVDEAKAKEQSQSISEYYKKNPGAIQRAPARGGR